jgi:photosynthetic reaction center cytochrome c subunit
MVREVNNTTSPPRTEYLPEHRKGPLGDPQGGLQTCHQGAYKPLYGAPRC